MATIDTRYDLDYLPRQTRPSVRNCVASGPLRVHNRRVTAVSVAKQRIKRCFASSRLGQGDFVPDFNF
jgi:hypothetical protein